MITTGQAQSVTQTTATLEGTVDPEGVETTYQFAYIDQAGYEKALAGDPEEKADPYTEGETTPEVSAGAGTEPQTIPPTPVSGLRTGHTYYYTLIANERGRPADRPTVRRSRRPRPAPRRRSAPAPSAASARTRRRCRARSRRAACRPSTASKSSTDAGRTLRSGRPGLGSLGGAATEAVTPDARRDCSPARPTTTASRRPTRRRHQSQGEPETFTTPGFPTLIAPPASPPLVATPAIAFPTETGTTTTTTSTAKPLTKAQKLTKALKACKKDKKNKRTACEKQARKRFQPAKQKKHKQ